MTVLYLLTFVLLWPKQKGIMIHYLCIFTPIGSLHYNIVNLEYILADL